MARIKFHTVTAIVVLVAAGAWVATGKFSFVGSAIGDGDAAAAAASDAPQASAAQSAEAAAPPRPANELPTVAFVTASVSDYDRTIRMSGQTEPDKHTVLVARTSGAIADLPVDEGTRVAEDDLVMALDGPEKYAAVESAEALFESRSRQAEVNEELLARGKIPSLTVDASKAEQASARSMLEAARAEVNRMELRSPFAGIVDEVFVEEGSWVEPGTEVASVLALDPIIAVGEVSERDLRLVSTGMSASVTFGDGTSAEGEIRYIRREASELTRTFPIEVAVPNPDAAIPAGMSVEIALAARARPAVTVPRSIITLAADGTVGVRTLNPDDTVAFLPVTIIDDTPGGLIVAGIESGTRVIVSGQDLVTEGQKVAATDYTRAAAGLQDSN